MKKILVPTDFSPVADNAIQYALEIAAGFKSVLYLCHVYAFNKINYDIAFPKNNQPYAKEMEQLMERTARRFSEKARERGVVIRTFVKEDSFYSLFKSKVEELGIDMIVMGSKGASGLTKFIFGSVAATALEVAEAPVLIIPPRYAFHPFQNIVLARDQKRLAAEVLSPLRNLAIQYGAQITLLNVKTEPNQHPGSAAELSLDGVETAFREVLVSKSIGETVNHYVQEENADLLCMVRRKKTFFESIFQKSITKVQAFSNQVPLLVLPKG